MHLLSGGLNKSKRFKGSLEKQNRNEDCVCDQGSELASVKPFSIQYQLYKASRSGLENQMTPKQIASLLSLTDFRPSSCVFGNLWRIHYKQGVVM